jgi:hypothetical protein
MEMNGTIGPVEVMNSPDPHKTIVVPLTAVTTARSGGGKFFRSSKGDAGTGEFTKKGVRAGGYAWPGKPGVSRAARQEEDSAYRFAFSLLYLFTLLLYARPNDLIPAMGAFPLAKIVAIVAPLAYVYARYRLGKPIINWTIEVKMVLVMLFLAVLFTPIAASPGDSAAALSDVFIKTVIIFILIIGLVNTRERLQAMIKLTTFCGTWLAVFAIKNYATGNLTMKGDRIEGLVGGMFGNPNDLAAALNMLIPLAVALALMNAGGGRLRATLVLWRAGDVLARRIYYARRRFRSNALEVRTRQPVERGPRRPHRVRPHIFGIFRRVSFPARDDPRSQRGRVRFGATANRVDETRPEPLSLAPDHRPRHRELSHLLYT